MKVKYMLLGSLLTIMLIFISSIVIIPFNKKELISVKPLESYTTKVTKLRNEIDNVKDNKCKTSLTNMLNRINETNFNDPVSLEEYYNAYYKDGIPFIQLFEETVNECALTDVDDIYIEVLKQSVFPDMMKERYLLSHELVLKDNSSRKVLTKQNTEKGTFITKTLELDILKSLISEVKNEKN